MLKSIRTALTVAAVTLSLSGLATNAMADTQWQKTHPRREQVNKRLANQSKRIHQERKEGEITKAQAAKLHREDRAIRREERTMASTNGGHIPRPSTKRSTSRRTRSASRSASNTPEPERRERGAPRSRRLVSAALEATWCLAAGTQALSENGVKFVPRS